MCGIAGVMCTEPSTVGRFLLSMLHGCQHRGPDSTGLALYAPPTDGLVLRLFLDADMSQDPPRWSVRQSAVEDVLNRFAYRIEDTQRQGAFLRLSGSFDGDIQHLSYAVEELPGVEIFSAGRSLEILKDEGTAEDIDRKYRCGDFMGRHGIGHVRLATESDVNPSTAHPFWAYGFEDVAIVHNGQITNYFKLRRRLEQRGYRFRTENDSEVIAVYLADKLATGVPLDEALTQAVDELDGTFSFLVSTPEGIGYAKDRIGAKPMIVGETEGMIAVASEEVSLRRLFGEQDVSMVEPYPGTSYTWWKSTEANLASAR